MNRQNAIGSARDRIQQSVRPAATRAPADADRLVDVALRTGAAAAREGWGLPLFVLLDVVSLLSHPRPRSGFPDRGRSQTKWTRPYDEWLDQFAHELRLAATSNERSGRTADAQERLHQSALAALSLLTDAWPGRSLPRALKAVERACEQLADDDAARRSIAAEWGDERDATEATWKKWWMAQATAETQNKPVQFSPAAHLWSRFRLLNSEGLLHERFDHFAADFFLNCGDLRLAAEQLTRLRRIELIEAEQSRNRVDSRDYPTWQDGAVMLSTLVKGKAAPSDIVNHRDVRLAGPPEGQPPPAREVHLSWLVGWNSVTRFVTHGHPAKNWGATARALTSSAEPTVAPQCCKDTAGQSASSGTRSQDQVVTKHEGPWKTTEASMVQSLTAILLDDWRVALCPGKLIAGNLGVRLHLHRAAPRAWSVSVGRPGPSWRPQPDIRSSDETRLPPPSVVDTLFRRTAWTDVCNSNRETWPSTSNSHGHGRQWWCGLLAKCDLADLGFACRDSAIPGAPLFWAKDCDGRLPGHFRHVIVVEPATFEGWVCRVQRIEGECQLRPLCASRADSPADPPFSQLRRLALNTLLDAISAAQ